MQQGWMRRRQLETQVGKAALRAAEREGRRAPRLYAECCTREEQLAYLLALSQRGDTEAFRELTEIIWGSEDEVRFAAREALQLAAAHAQRRAEASVQQELHLRGG